VDKNNNKKQIHKKIKSVKATGNKAIKTDVQGSYTGVPDDPYDKPIQDADDL
jgi:hypothetical protein